MDHRKLLGRRVRKLRKAARVTIEQAAERAHLSGNYWGEVERSKKVPSLDTIVAMASALDVPLHVLLHLEHEQDQRNLRASIDAMLGKCSRDQLELVHRITKAIVEP